MNFKLLILNKFYLFYLIIPFLVFSCGESESSKITFKNGSELACNIFDELQLGVAKDQIPIKDIKIMIKELEAASMRSSDKILEASKRFVVAAEEAATNYYVYPTFHPLAYDDTYEHMANHVETFLSLQKLTKACEEEGIEITSPSLEDPEEDVTIRIEYTIPEDAIVKNLYEANVIIEKYLNNFSWGDFGAKCDQWLKMDYQISENRSFLDIQTNKWVIKYFLKDGKILGPNPLKYYIDITTKELYSDEKNNINSHIAEGCDQW
ncbi:MAG: hypothetical protein CL907_01845 [Dehalococcoidia bacterium]|nr:hypothetical protein [Dehalococcoidia bacterium]|tara:strand:+ start:14728 stop:15522 length:795 start_codon:yes stop_codon:yes gene_type:complete